MPVPRPGAAAMSDERLMCLMCPRPYSAAALRREPFAPASAAHRFFYWGRRVDHFWAQHPVLAALFAAAPPFFLALCIGLAAHEEARDLVAVPLTLFVIFHALSNRIPLAPLPPGATNAVTNPNSKYAGAADALFSVLLAVLVLAIGTELLRTLQSAEPHGQARRVIKRTVSSMVVAAPVVVAAYLAVASMYTELCAGNPITPRFTDPGSGESNTDRVHHAMLRLRDDPRPAAREMCAAYFR